MIHGAFPSWYATATARRSVAINTLSAWHICTCRTLCVPFMFWDRWTQQSCVSKARPESFTHDLYEGSRVTGLMYHRSRCQFIPVKLWVFFILGQKEELKVMVKAFLNLYKMTSCALFFLWDWPHGLNSVQNILFQSGKIVCTGSNQDSG